jgi:Zn-dependent protease with chaperone function
VSAARELFSAAEIERGRRYHRALYLGYGAGIVLTLAVLGLLASPAGDGLYALVDGLPWWLAAPAFAALVAVVLNLVRAPLAYVLGFVRERRWGLSTQRLGGWLGDRAKGLGVAAALSAITFLGLDALVRLLPSAWPVATSLAAAALVLLLAFLAPVVLEPLFNRFEPLDDEGLRARLHSLAERVGTPVREVLVADASRRTAKANAYVSGLGASRRVVVYDTFLERNEPREVAVVVAHELAHRRERHVARFTLLGMVGAALAVVVLWLVLGSGAGDPRNVPLVLLVLTALELVALPLTALLSRRWERVADRVALEVTGDGEAMESAFRVLAETNVADLEPPPVLHALLGTHPTIPERIAAARAAASAR